MDSSRTPPRVPSALTVLLHFMLGRVHSELPCINLTGCNKLSAASCSTVGSNKACIAPGPPSLLQESHLLLPRLSYHSILI